jgi:predicted O-linked N-acetylglucosamine transferase (SPINDLY family)
MAAPSPLFQQAHAHVQARRFAQARPLLLNLLHRDPGDLNALRLLGITLTALQQVEQAEHACRRAIERLRGDPKRQAVAWGCLGLTLAGSRRINEGLTALQTALDLDPDNLTYLRELCFWRFELGEHRAALELARRGLALAPRDPDFLLKVAVAHQLLGRPEEAVGAYEEAVRLLPDDPALAEALAQAMHYVPGLDPGQIREAHDRFGDMMAALTARTPLQMNPARRTLAPGEPLRVGLISADLRQHSVAFFVDPILRHAGTAGVEYFVYSACVLEDQKSAELRALVPPSRWRHLAGASPANVAPVIANDRLDILIDLAGLTRDNPGRVMMLRPAPVQVTYLGYPNATGLPTVQYRIVDSLTDPPPPHPSDSWSRQTLLRLDPCFLCYGPPSDLPPPSSALPPSQTGGRPFVFGCFNALMKLNDRLLGWWARLLEQVPGSTLLLKTRGLEHAAVARELSARLAAAGIDPARTTLEGHREPMSAHLRAYHDVDLALDTWPYNGTTTTLEALLMGVPVVTLAGEHHASRVGLSLLTNLRLPDLVTTTPEAYIRAAADLARDRQRLAAMREGLRERLLASPICDGPGFAARFADLLRSIA